MIRGSDILIFFRQAFSKAVTCRTIKDGGMRNLSDKDFSSSVHLKQFAKANIYITSVLALKKP